MDKHKTFFPSTKRARMKRGLQTEQRTKKPLDQVPDVVGLKHHAIRTVQELLGCRNVKATMIYSHVTDRSGLAYVAHLIE